jgi:hypothetical protein
MQKDTIRRLARKSAASAKPLLHRRNLEAPHAAVFRHDLATSQGLERGFAFRRRLAVGSRR